MVSADFLGFTDVFLLQNDLLGCQHLLREFLEAGPRDEVADLLRDRRIQGGIRHPLQEEPPLQMMRGLRLKRADIHVPHVPEENDLTSFETASLVPGGLCPVSSCGKRRLTGRLRALVFMCVNRESVPRAVVFCAILQVLDRPLT